MRREEVLRLIGRFGRRRILFHTFDDHYALARLAWQAGDGAEVHALRQGPCARLLQKPRVRERLAVIGRPVLSDDDLLGFWPEEYRSYVVTLGCWPIRPRKPHWDSFYQMARGDSNLVVQLDFDHAHDRLLRRTVDSDLLKWLENGGHFCARNRNVLAWARVDIETQRREALIEEIQSDWVRHAKYSLRVHHFRGTAEERGRLREVRSRYYNEILAPHRRQWAESTLLATLGFLREALGVRRVWYYSYETGCAVKGMGDYRPPRSYYTELPKRFCFTKREEGPQWIESLKRVRKLRKRAEHPWRWFVMEE